MAKSLEQSDSSVAQYLESCLDSYRIVVIRIIKLIRAFAPFTISYRFENQDLFAMK